MLVTCFHPLFQLETEWVTIETHGEGPLNQQDHSEIKWLCYVSVFVSVVICAYLGSALATRAKQGPYIATVAHYVST